MTLVSLLTVNEGHKAAFGFEHAMAHRNYLGQMAPLDRFSVIPYLLDPMQDLSIPGSSWHLDHQQAHNDALVSIPSYYQGPDGAAPTTVQTGLFIGQNLRDYNLDNLDQLRWWTFTNHVEHYIANGVTLPASQDPPPQTFPFW